MPYQTQLSCGHMIEKITTDQHSKFKRGRYKRLRCKYCNNQLRKIIFSRRVDTIRYLGIAFIPTAIMICSSLYNIISL